MAKTGKNKKDNKTSKIADRSQALKQHQSVIKFLNQELILTLTEIFPSDATEFWLLDLLLKSKGPVPASEVAKFTRLTEGAVSQAVPRLNEYLDIFSKKCEVLETKQITFQVPRKKPGGASFGYYLAFFDKKKKVYLSATEAKELYTMSLQQVRSHNQSAMKEFREGLKTEALKHIKEKLHGEDIDDYRPLELKIGLIEGSGREEEELYYDPETHNRVWKEFECNELKNPQGIYILSSEVGSGKTTFLRKLQLTIIEKTELIPIFIEASRIDLLAFMERDTEDFLISVGKLVNRNPKNDFEEDFLITHRDRIVFLIDGLDQIKGTGSEYDILIDKLLGVIKNKIIITSRPFAVTEQERDQNIKFLALNPFGEVDVQAYFKEKYKRAKELCRTCPEMIHIPMLAYMVRHLIEKGKDQGIKNRTSLYKNFIDGIFEQYRHENLKVSEEKKFKIRKAYGEISFKAIANDLPYLQKIPSFFAIECKETNIEIDDLFKYGIANTIINRTQGNKKLIYFSHQSFQEYLAAEYISQSDRMVQQVLSEKWNPKWRDVIKFLTGIRGQEIIKAILDEKDNPIHSKLFFSAELVRETDIDLELKKKISQKLKELSKNSLFTRIAWIYSAYVNEAKVINELMSKLEDESRCVCLFALSILEELKDFINHRVVEKIAEKIGDEDNGIRRAAIEALDKLKSNLDSKAVEKIVDKLESEDYLVRCSAVSALGRLNDKVDSEIVRKIADRLDDENNEVRCEVLSALVSMNDKLNNVIIEKIADMLEDENDEVFYLTIETLRELKDKLNSETVKKIADRLEDENSVVFFEVVNVLVELQDKLDDKIVKKITAKLEDEDYWVRCLAVSTLGRLNGKVDSEIVRKIVDRLEDENYEVRSSAIEALGKLKDNICSETVETVIDKLEDEDYEVRSSVVSTLWKLNDKVDSKMVRKIVDRLEDDNNEVRCSAIEALGKLKDKLSVETVKKIADRLKDENNFVRLKVIGVLVELQDKLDDKIVKKIIDKLEDEDYIVRSSAVHALVKLNDKVDSEIVRKIVDRLEDENYEVRSSAVYALGRLNDKVSSEIVEKIADKLESDYKIRGTAEVALVELKDKLNIKILKKIVAINDWRTLNIFEKLYKYGKLELDFFNKV